ncbi:hypothetical protein [Bosea thiooxidans]
MTAHSSAESLLLAEQSATLGDALARHLGAVSLIDLTFPHCRYLGCDARPARVATMVEAGSPVSRFLAGFRQGGGHEPVTRLDRSRLEVELHRLLGEINGFPVLALESGEAAGALASIAAEWPAALLFPEGAEDPDLPGFSTLSLAREDGSAAYRLALPSAVRSALAPAPERIAARPDIPVVFDALRFLHDGGYKAEGNDSYSWLWTGPSPHFRLVAPRAPERTARSAEICVIRVESPWMLGQIRVQIDGRPAAHRFEHWSENSGKIVVELPQADDYTVIGIIVPAMDKDGYSGRPIGLCLDKLLLLPA